MKSVNPIKDSSATSGQRTRAEIAFLPAALEIVETPPSPTGRLLAAAVFVLFCLAIGWASFSEVDIVASAKGKIVPTSRTKVIQPFETGVVRAIHVHDGQSVKAGDVLIELDPTMNSAERGHIQSDLVSTELDIARLNAALSQGTDVLAEFHPPQGASAESIATHRQYLIKQTEEQRAKISSLDHQKVQKEAERATISATINKLNATIPIAQQLLDMRNALLKQELVSKVQYLDTLDKLVERQQDLAVEKSRYIEADAALSVITETRAQADAEFHRTLFDELAKAQEKAAGLQQDLVKAEQRTNLMALTAPVDGVVQQLAVHTIGGVVTPAQDLLALVPSDNHLEIEAMVSNQDIGFVEPGQEAEIKIDTFNFTRYGLLHGKVLDVSQDAITRQTPQNNANEKRLGSVDATSEPPGQELDYAAHISLDRTQMEVEDKFVNLSPGMAVTVEIKTGSRTIMSYLLSPLLRYKNESLRER